MLHLWTHFKTTWRSADTGRWTSSWTDLVPKSYGCTTSELNWISPHTVEGWWLGADTPGEYQTLVILGAGRIDGAKSDWPRLSRDVPRRFAQYLNWRNGVALRQCNKLIHFPWNVKERCVVLLRAVCHVLCTAGAILDMLQVIKWLVVAHANNGCTPIVKACQTCRLICTCPTNHGPRGSYN